MQFHLADNLLDGHVGLQRRAPYAQVVDTVEIDPLLVGQAHHDRQFPGAIAVDADRQAPEGEFQADSYLLVADSQPSGLGFIDHRDQLLAALLPVEKDTAGHRVGADNSGGLRAQLAQYFGIRTPETRFDLRTGRGAEYHLAHLVQHLREARIHLLIQPRHQFAHDLQVVRAHLYLGEILVALLGHVGHEKARRPPAHRGGHETYARLLPHPGFQRFHCGQGGADIRAIGQPGIHVKHGRIGGRKESLLDVPHAVQGECQQGHHDDDDALAVVQRRVQQLPVYAVHQPLVGVPPGAVGGVHIAHQQVHQERGQGDRQDPAEEQ